MKKRTRTPAKHINVRHQHVKVAPSWKKLAKRLGRLVAVEVHKRIANLKSNRQR